MHLMLRSFIIIDPHLINLIRENPKYTKMSLEEILGKFVSGCMTVKEATNVNEVSITSAAGSHDDIDGDRQESRLHGSHLDHDAVV